jgi:DNA-binding beta-propeller fold protein YncE
VAKLIVGTGDTTWEVIHPFGRLPRGWSFGNVSHVATDSKDNVYVFQRKDPPVIVLDSGGNFITGWGTGVLYDAHGIFITAQDDIYLIDRDYHEVLKFNKEGKVQMRLGKRERPAFQAPFNHPADIAVAPNGDLYIVDGYGNSNVHHFSGDGKHLKTWGTPGAKAGQFTTPHGVWVDGRERVYVCDRENNRVQIFSLEGDYVGEWGDFFHPMDIFMDSQGRFFVSDQIPRISVLDSSGKLISRGKTAANPHGIWLDGRGNMYTGGNEAGVTKYRKV